MKPLPTTHPELEIHKNLPLSIEYRVRNRKLAKDGSGRVLLGYGYSTWDLVVALLIWIIWNRSQSPLWCLLPAAFFIKTKCTQLLYESIIAFPALGVQIESHRGLSIPFTGKSIVLSVSRRFLSMDVIHDVLINEGLRHWDWKYYLVVLRRLPPRSEDPDLSLFVVFENILPPFEVVREVYHGVRETLFDEYEGS